jgi:hypothetical protein
MPNLNPNSTNYVHTYEPNTNDLVHAMDYNSSGQPVLRVKTATGPGDDGNLTSKGRSKVSPYETVFFNTFQFGTETDVWETDVTGTGSATHAPASSQVLMSINGDNGDKVIRQTLLSQRYVPGRSSTVSFAITLGTPVEGIRKRLGMFNQAGDGFWFEDSGVWADGEPIYNCTVSNGGTDIAVPRSAWNGDKLDGTSTSGITADPTKIQLVNIEYEWYGAGQVKFGWVIDGATHVVHTHRNANRRDRPWAQTPFLPIRVEIEALSTVAGGPYTMLQGSNSVISEGTVGKLGIAQNISAPFYGTRMAAALSSDATKDNWYPILSIRLKSTALNGIVLPQMFQVATIDNTNIFYKLVRNATIPAAVTAGASGPQPWLDHPDPNGFTQYQTYITPANITEANHGSVLDSGFVISGGGGTGVRLEAKTAYQIGRSSLGTVSDVFTIMCASNGTGKDALASFTWIEQR